MFWMPPAAKGHRQKVVGLQHDDWLRLATAQAAMAIVVVQCQPFSRREAGARDALAMFPHALDEPNPIQSGNSPRLSLGAQSDGVLACLVSSTPTWQFGLGLGPLRRSRPTW